MAESPPGYLWQIGVVRVWQYKHGLAVNMHFRSHSDRAQGSANDQAGKPNTFARAETPPSPLWQIDFFWSGHDKHVARLCAHPSDLIKLGQRSRLCR
ncbi:unnamed protein product [Ectocarpus sp. 8 AP-2014]